MGRAYSGFNNSIVKLLIKQCGRELNYSARRVIWRPCFQVPPRPLAGFVLGNREVKSSATLVNSQLDCILPVAILILVTCMFLICFICVIICEKRNYNLLSFFRSNYLLISLTYMSRNQPCHHSPRCHFI